jgi:hypothetical protein
VPDVSGLAIRDIRCLFIASFGFLPEQDGIKVFNVNPARVTPALGQIR